MKASCVCCQALEAKATGVKATLVLLFTLVDDKIRVANVVDALCREHGKSLDAMIYRLLVPPSAKSALRKPVKRAPLPPPPPRKKHVK